MEQEHKETVLTMQELIALINNTEEDFLISIPLEGEAGTNAKEE
jgi:hypothetical protein